MIPHLATLAVIATKRDRRPQPKGPTMTDTNALLQSVVPADVIERIKQRIQIIREQDAYSKQVGHAAQLGFLVEQHADAILPLLATDRAAGVAFPDIGVDPLKAKRPDDRLAASVEVCREAYVRQQRGVPDQTALVWRWHLGALLEAAQRLKLLQSHDAPAVSQSAPDLRYAVAALERLKRERLCGGDDCTEYDHGVDEGLDLALAEVRKTGPVDASEEVEPSRLVRGLQDVWEEIDRLNERCFGAGSEASVSVRTSDLSEVIDVIRDNLPRNPAAGAA